jgi:phosphate-selective porin
MKKTILILFLSTVTLYGYSQTQLIDSLKEAIDNHQGKLNALDERVLVNEADLGKLNKIKVSGYIQSQWEYYDKDLVKPNEPNNTFYIRRARVKFTYEAVDGVKFVLQPDFSTGNLSLKDAYAVLNLPKLKDVTLWAGQFSRPNYEVEYSSGQREVLERSRVIKAIYPGEREVGLKLEYTGSSLPLKFQIMAMNGNFSKGTEQKDVDSKKDILGRLVYSIKIPSAGIGIDLGVNGYFGGIRVKNTTNKYTNLSDGTLDSLQLGNYLNRQWYGAEIQIFADIFGGLALKGEYIFGINSTLSTLDPAATTLTLAKLKADPNKIRNFSGYYIYLIKNVGAKNQFVARYDYYDPNTKLAGDAAGKEINYKTLTLAWQYYLNDNIRISLNYEMPQNEKSSSVKNLEGTAGVQLKDNVLGVRIQAKF